MTEEIDELSIGDRRIEAWHFSKSIPIAVLVSFIGYAVIGVWSYSKLVSQVEHITNVHNIDKNIYQEKLEIKTEDRFKRAEALQRLEILQVQISANADQIKDSNNRMDRSLDHISRKLDRLFERKYHLFGEEYNNEQ